MYVAAKTLVELIFCFRLLAPASRTVLPVQTALNQKLVYGFLRYTDTDHNCYTPLSYFKTRG